MAFTAEDGTKLQGEIVEVQTLLERQKDINRALTGADNMMQAHLDKVEATQKDLMMMILKIQEKGTKNGGKSPMEMVARRSFQSIGSYEGKREDCENWRFAITGFFEEEPMFVDFIRFLDGHTAKGVRAPLDQEITEENLNEYEQAAELQEGELEWLCHNMFQVLRRKLGGPALETLKAQKEKVKTRGPITWRKLLTDAKGQRGQREGGLVSRVYTPKRATSWTTLEATLASWRNHRAEYLSDGKTMEEDAQVNAIKMLVPTELEQLIRDQGDRLNKLADLENFISYQLVSRKDPVFEGGSSKGDKAALMNQFKALLMSDESDQPPEVPQEEECGQCDTDDFLMAMKGFWKGGKGNGKGGFNGGKGGFTGECFYCKKMGHRQYECRSREADVQAGKVAPLPPKGQGKGGKGEKGSWPGKGGDGKGGKGGNLFAWMEQMIAGTPKPEESQEKTSEQPWGRSWMSCVEKEPRQPSWEMKNRFAAIAEEEEGEDVIFNRFQTVSDEKIDFIDPRADAWTPLGQENLKKPENKKGVKAPRVARNAWTVMACPLMEMSARDFPLAPASERPAKEETAKKSEELLCSLGVTVDPASGYRRVRSVMDSGATKGVMHPNSFPDFAVQPSPGSKRGAVFGTAGSDELPNLGMWNLPAISAEGETTTLKTQVAEVSLPLSSVGETCDEGNLVIFSAKGGLVCSITTGNVKRFGREEGMYILEQWVPPATGFPRPK